MVPNTVPAVSTEAPAVPIVDESELLVAGTVAAPSDVREGTVVPNTVPAVSTEAPAVPIIDEVPATSEETSATLTEQRSMPLSVPPSPVSETQAVPAITDPPIVAEQSDGSAGDFFDTPLQVADEPERSSNGALTRLWAHPWTKLAALCLVVVVVVVVIIGGLRLAHKDPNSGSGPTPTTATLPTTNHAAITTTTQAAVASPLTAAQLTQYKQNAATFNAANATTKAGLATAGSSPTLAQITPVVANYLNALKLYNLQFHYVQWPTSLQTDVATDETQLNAMLSFLPSISSVTAPDTGTWLAQLHTQAATLQTADNKIRQDLGLSASTSFP